MEGVVNFPIYNERDNSRGLLPELQRVLAGISHEMQIRWWTTLPRMAQPPWWKS